jgi:hypothetical protein
LRKVEIILQWLDDLDDLVSSGVSLCESVRGGLLQVGLLAALALHTSQWWSVAAEHTYLLAGVALLSVVVWAIAVLGLTRTDFRRERIQAPT